MTVGVALVVIGMSASSHAQLGGRRAATLEALAIHRVFFHGQEVIVRADVVGDGVLAYLVDDTTRLLVLDVRPPPDGVRERLEIIGLFYDIGEFEPDDPRTPGQPFARLSERLLNKPWPGVGELPVLVAASTRPAAEPSAPTRLRTVALDPERFVAQGVTVTGRFRGRNLYGDLPEAPGESRYDFVLVSAEAAVWVVGQEPKGDGFDLDVQARVDTGRWLEVTGEVRFAKGMVLIEAGTITLADPPKKPVSPAVLVTRRAPPPEVIFTAPLEGDADVPSDTTVRIQFSRDMDPDSFESQVRIHYATAASVSVDLADANPPVTDFEVEYLGRNRVLLIRFVEELERFRTLSVELLEGITASDGVPIESWALSFFVGG